MNDQTPDLGRLIKVEWPDIERSVYANNAIVQTEDGVLMISFYQVNSPLLLGSKEEQIEALAKIDTLKAVPVVRIAFPSEKLGRLIEALQQQLSDPHPPVDKA